MIHNHRFEDVCDVKCPAHQASEVSIATSIAKYWKVVMQEDNKQPGKQVQAWSDNAMFASPPLDKEGGPRVHLLSMTPDPLGTIAAVNNMYTGKGVKALSEITDEERRRHWEQVTKTRLKAPFEFVKFHFFIEGVTRAFTHQMVRQRTATYAQESLRFAVVEDHFSDRVGLPPSLAGTDYYSDPEEMIGTRTFGRLPAAQQARIHWDAALERTQAAYSHLIESGVPAEDARGLLPTNVLTRLHYTTDLRALLDHAGSRLCTQAQFEWRQVWAQMIQAIREYGRGSDLRLGHRYELKDVLPSGVEFTGLGVTRWQQEEISKLFKPICYQTGKCEFMSEDDRTCSIRNRVQANHDIGRGSENWGEEYDTIQNNPIVSGVGPHSVVREEEGGRPVFIGAIQPVEWLADPTAARKNGGGHLGG